MVVGDAALDCCDGVCESASSSSHSSGTSRWIPAVGYAVEQGLSALSPLPLFISTYYFALSLFCLFSLPLSRFRSFFHSFLLLSFPSTVVVLLRHLCVYSPPTSTFSNSFFVGDDDGLSYEDIFDILNRNTERLRLDSYTVARATPQRMFEYLIADTARTKTSVEAITEVLKSPSPSSPSRSPSDGDANDNDGGGRRGRFSRSSSGIRRQRSGVRVQGQTPSVFQQNSRGLGMSGLSNVVAKSHSLRSLPSADLRTSPLRVIVKKAFVGSLEGEQDVVHLHQSDWRSWTRRPFFPCYMAGCGHKRSRHRTRRGKEEEKKETSHPLTLSNRFWVVEKTRKQFFKIRLREQPTAVDDMKAQLEEEALIAKEAAKPSCLWEWPKNVSPGASILLVDVSYVSREWDDIHNLFFRSMSRTKYELVRVQRIQNYEIWNNYAQERVRLLRQNGAEGLNERFLFHGTSSRDPCVIYEGMGFDLRLASQRNYYGRGIYFAVSCC